jgi:hypothetical protein
MRCCRDEKPPFTAWSIVGEGAIGSPSAHMRSFQLSHVSRSVFPDQRFAVGPKFLCQSARRPSSSCALCRVPSAGPCGPLRKGAWGDIPAPSGHPSEDNTGRQRPRKLRRLERGPAAVVLAAACALSAAVVEEAHPDVFPDRMAPVETDGVSRLNLDDTVTAPAGHPQHVAGDL